MHIDKDHQLLPPEIWLEVFEWAFDSHIQVTEYAPFQSPPGDNRFHDANLNIRSTIPLVCRDWRAWSTALLYQDIRIKNDAYALKQALERSTVLDEGLGKWVRRVVLPYPSTVTGPSGSLTSIEILRLCPEVNTLVRPRLLISNGLRFEFDAQLVKMLHLRRLEWWHYNEAERSGGINSLGAVLQCAPNIQYLFVGGVLGYSNIGMERSPVCLPMLHTIRLHTINGLLLHQIVTRWSLPAMSRIIADSPMPELGLDRIWETFGTQLKTVEFGKHLRFMLEDNLSICLKGCPNLEEINYYLFFTAIPDVNDYHSSVRSVGLHGAINSFLADEEAIWIHLDSHITVLGGMFFPNLREIVLHGEWKGILSHCRFTPLMRRLNDRGIILRTANCNPKI